MMWVKRSVAIPVLVAASIVGVNACSEVVTPRARPTAGVPIARAWDQPDAPTAQLTPNPLNGAGSVSLEAHYPQQTLVRVIASGYVVQHDNYGMVPDANLGPNINVAVVEVFPNGSTSAFAFPNNGGQAADTITMGFIPGSSISVATRNPTSYLTRHGVLWNGQYIYCDTSTDPPCFTFTGGHSIQVEPVPASYTASVDSATYSIGSTATIAMTTSPAVILGATTPIHVDSAVWVPAPDSLGGNGDDAPTVVGCTNYHWRDMYSRTGSDWLCNHYVYGAGTLTLIGHANGFRQTPSIQISIRDPRLTLEASRTRVHANDTVLFTPKWSDGLPPAPYQWKWFPDSLPQPNAPNCAQTAQSCTQVVHESGTMKVWVMRNGIRRAASAHVTVYETFDLLADSNAAHLQSNVRFTPRLDGKTTTAMRWRWTPQDSTVSDSTSCKADTTCVKQMVSTGTMWAYLDQAGGDSASAAVAIISDTIGCGSNSFASVRGPSLSCTGGDDELIPQLHVTCFFPGQTMTRGQTVRCETSVTPDTVGFTIVRREGNERELEEIDSLPPFAKQYLWVTETVDSTILLVAPGGKDVWEGPAILPTNVTVTAQVPGLSSPITATTNFTPSPRSWSRWYWNEGQAERHDSVMSVGGFASPGTFSTFPQNDEVNGVLQSTTLGLFLPQLPDSSTYTFNWSVSGPNGGLAYLSGSPASPSYKLYVHPALRRPVTLPTSALRDSVVDWQSRQNGGGTNPRTQLPWCDGAGLDSMYRLSQRHEGWTKALNSHWGIADSLFAAYQPQFLFEEITTSSLNSGKERVWTWYKTWFYYHGPNVYYQIRFDDPTSGDYYAISNICTFKQ